VQCIDENFRDEFVKTNNELIFSCMEAGKQPYSAILQMPVSKLTAYLKWKHDFEDQKSKMMEEMNSQ